VVKDLRSASSGFSLTPESRLSAAAVEAENHNPKLLGKEEACGDQGKVDVKERKAVSQKNGTSAGGYGQIYGSFSTNSPPPSFVWDL
jgi:hypothetical protein